MEILSKCRQEHTSIIEKHNTGAATLLMSMLAKAATNIFAMSTVLGFVPALLSTNVAIRLSILVLDKAAARVKPPSNSMMTGVHIAAKMYAVAFLESSLLWGGSSEMTTLRRTQRKGTIREVTNSGIACDRLISVPMLLQQQKQSRLPRSPKAD